MQKKSLQDLHRLTVDEYKAQPKIPLVLVLDNIRSALNVGSVFRTADAFKVERLALCGITAQPPHRDILKTAIGATESVDWLHYDSTLEAVQALQAAGYHVLALEQAAGSTSLLDFEVLPAQPYAIVLGNEVKGVDEAVMAAVNGCLEVPQFGTKHSLNVSVCTGLVVWEWFKQWAQQQA